MWRGVAANGISGGEKRSNRSGDGNGNVAKMIIVT